MTDNGTKGQNSTANERCRRIRKTIARLSHEANSAHLGSCLSCVEILDAILGASDIRPECAAVPNRDRLIVSKGHAAMAVYAALAEHQLLDPAMLNGYLNNGSALWGHVTSHPHIPAIDASTGSLGHGLGLACGYALGYRLRGITKRVFTVLSDGECNEGSTWEAALFAGHHKLSAIHAVVDYNKIQSLAACHEVMNPEPFAEKWKAFGWSVTEVDGHDTEALCAALALDAGAQPHLIIAHTVKGKGIARIENTIASHYKPALATDIESLE